MIKGSKKNKVLIFLLVSILIIGTIFSIVVISKINSTTSNNTPSSTEPETPDPTIPEETPSQPIETPTLTVESKITIDKLETIKFEYEASNCENHTITIRIENPEIAEITEENIIQPKQVGVTKIITEINCSPKISKFTELTIEDAVTNSTLKILNLDNIIQTQFYTNRLYFLEITENAVVNTLPTIRYSEQTISNFQFVSKTKNVLKYQFKIIKFGNFIIEHMPKHEEYKQSINGCAYVFPNTFSVSFSNVSVLDNKFTLYLINNTYSTQANSDGIFSCSTFSFNTVTNSNDSIQVNTNNNCIEISNNTIHAKEEGSCIITFTSKISNIEKEFVIDVVKVVPTSITINNSTYNLNQSATLNLEINKPTNFNVEILPKYAYGNLSFNYSNGLSLSNNTISRLTNAEQYLSILFNETEILNINIPKIDTYSIQIKQYGTNKVLIDKLSCLFDNTYITLFCQIVNSETTEPTKNQELMFEISNPIVKSSTDSYQLKNGYVTLELLSKGSTTLTIYSSELNISKQIILEIN